MIAEGYTKGGYVLDDTPNKPGQAQVVSLEHILGVCYKTAVRVDSYTTLLAIAELMSQNNIKVLKL